MKLRELIARLPERALDFEVRLLEVRGLYLDSSVEYYRLLYEGALAGKIEHYIDYGWKHGTYLDTE
nr:MAG TPA: S35 Mitochondrial ribosomal protein MRP-S35 [Caudoviricetes sp.]